MDQLSKGDRVFVTGGRYGEGIVDAEAADGTITVEFPVANSVTYKCSLCNKDPHPRVYLDPTSKNPVPAAQFICIGAARIESITHAPDPIRENFPSETVVLVLDDDHLSFLYHQRNKALGLS